MWVQKTNEHIYSHMVLENDFRKPGTYPQLAYIWFQNGVVIVVVILFYIAKVSYHIYVANPLFVSTDC